MKLTVSIHGNDIYDIQRALQYLLDECRSWQTLPNCLTKENFDSDSPFILER